MSPSLRRLLAATASAALAHAVVIGGYAWYASARARELQRVTKERDELATRVRMLELVSAKQAEFEVKRQEQREEPSALETIVPRHAALEPLQRELADLARKQALTLQRTSPKAEIAKDGHAEIPLELEAHGRAAGLLDFVARLARLPRLLTLSDIRIEHVEGQRYRLVATVTAYRYTAKP